jgi:HD-GYP domain-containing protein (c-di-GMP phosphodiesterase class II)
MSQKRVEVADLELGMYVVELDRPWLETSFLFQGFPILSEEDISELQRCCDYVYVDEEQSILLQPEHFDAAPHGRPVQRFSTRRINRKLSARKHPPDDNRVEIAEEMPRAREVYHQAKRYINTIFDDIRQGSSLDIEHARVLADHTVASITNNENAMVWLTLLKRKDEYTSFHSINVCVLSVLFGRHLGLTESELGLLGLGALLHDIGKMRVPVEVLNKASKLEAAELGVLRKHPDFGREILEQSTTIPPAAKEIVYTHHERIDGSGYPRGLKGDELGLFPMIVSVVDVYDAMTSDRAYHMRISPHEALNVMYGWSASHFDPKLIEEFIRCLGIYPVGSIVELSSGEVAVVLTVNREHHLLPSLLLVLDRHKNPYDVPKLMNLELQQSSGVNIFITKILPSGIYGIDVRQLVADLHIEKVPAS